MQKAIITFFIIVFLASCTKFDEGPKFSPFSKNFRIKRTWEIEYLYNIKNDEYYYKDFDGWTLTFYDESKYLKKIIYNGKETIEEGVWKFEDDTLFIIYYPDIYTIEKKYKTLRLTQKELWIRNDIEEIHYRAIK